MRQAEPDVRSYAVTHPAGPLAPPQAPGWSQLIYASSGVLAAYTATGTWTIPPHRALWVPAGVGHRLVAVHRSSLRTLYFGVHLAVFPGACRVVEVAPLLRELILHMVAIAPLTMGEPRHARLVAVLLDLLADLPSDGALLLPMPTDPISLTVADLPDELSIAALCHRVGISRRTLERRYLAQTGMTFGQWRRRRRMLAAIEHLAGGKSVADTAQLVGYATPSAFTAAFHAELGAPPSQWLPG